MSSSPNLLLPYPGEDDLPDGPVQIEALIDRLEALRGGYAEIGSMMDWSGRNDPPSGCWMITDNRKLLRTDYPNLFAVLGTTYNIGGEASTEFRLPNIVRRVVYAPGPGDLPGQVGGSESVMLATVHMPSHNHGGATVSSGPTTGWMDRNNSHNHGGATGGMDRANPHSHGDSGHAHAVGNLHNSSNASLLLYGGSMEPGHAGSYTSPGVGTQGTDTRNVGVTATDINHLHGISAQDINHLHAVPNLAIAAEGGGAAHPNMMPYILFYKIIRVK